MADAKTVIFDHWIIFDLPGKDTVFHKRLHLLLELVSSLLSEYSNKHSHPNQYSGDILVSHILPKIFSSFSDHSGRDSVGHDKASNRDPMTGSRIVAILYHYLRWFVGVVIADFEVEYKSSTSIKTLIGTNN